MNAPAAASPPAVGGAPVVLPSQRIPRGELTKVLGDADVVVVEFSDFECPYCGTFAREVFPAVKSRLVSAGRISYAAVHFPLEAEHPLAFAAGEAAECAAAQERFWEFRERLYSESQTPTHDVVGRLAAATALDAGRYAACLERDGAAGVIDDVMLGRRLGITVTPTFLIGTVTPEGDVEVRRQIVGSASFEVLEREITALVTASAQE
jgi:protein-disulfide isomerase